MDVVLSTRNPSKAEQVRAFFAGSNIRILTLDHLGIEGEVEEDGLTLRENAAKKAIFAAERSHLLALGDDTGLFIDALDRRPGIYATRWAGEGAATEEITQYTLEQLKGISNRRATFETVVVLATPRGDIFSFSGEARGSFLEAPRVPPQPKMPYSSIFVPDGTDKVWAEMTVEFENSISHRGKAFAKAKKFLEQSFGL